MKKVIVRNKYDNKYYINTTKVTDDYWASRVVDITTEQHFSLIWRSTEGKWYSSWRHMHALDGVKDRYLFEPISKVVNDL